jgi:hypothetical protein
MFNSIIRGNIKECSTKTRNGTQLELSISVVLLEHSSGITHKDVTWLQLQKTAKYLPWPFVVP